MRKSEGMSTTSRDITDKPDPDADPDHGKPESPTSLKGSAWKIGIKRALSEFSRDKCTDLAAGLTYFAVLSLFPALLAVVSLLGVFGQGQATVDAVMELLEGAAPEETLAALRGPSSRSSTPRPPASPSSPVSPVRCGRPRATSARSAGR